MIYEYFSYHSGSCDGKEADQVVLPAYLKNELTKKVALMCATDCEPFCVVNRRGFLNVVNYIFQQG